MLFKFELEGGNFSKAGYASSQIKKVLKQLAIDPRIIKRVVVALYEAEVNIVAHAWRGTVVAELDADKISLEVPFRHQIPSHARPRMPSNTLHA